MIPPDPVAFMGYAAIDTIRVCAWCPDKLKAEALAKKYQCKVTHGQCVPCYQKAIADLTGDTSG